MAQILNLSRNRFTRAKFFGANVSNLALTGLVRQDGSLPLTANWNAGNFRIDSQNSVNGFNVKAYGAIGDGITDDTAAIQATINAASAGQGGRVQFDALSYLISATLLAKGYTVLQGTAGENSSFGVVSSKSGTKLLWGGANTGTMLSVFNTRQFKLDGLNFDANTRTAITAILLDSNNTPSGSQNEFSRFSIRGCLLGVQWGTSGIVGGSFANDGTRFTTFTIWSQVTGSKGFVLNSGNAGQVSTIESGGIQVDSLAIDIVVANQLQIRRVFGGSALRIGFIRSSVGINLLIEGSSSEGTGSRVDGKISNDSYFLTVVAPGESHPVGDTTITMIQNYINNPVLVAYPVRIASIGDTWGYCFNAVGVSIGATGTFTAAAAGSRLGALNNGVNAATTHGWIRSANVKIFNFDPGLPLTAYSIVSTTGLTVNGTSGITATANQLAMDQTASLSRFYSYGPDGATRGSYELHVLTSAGTSDIIPIAVSNAGVLTLGTLASLTVTAAPTFSALTPGSIPFAGAAGLLSQDNASLFWNNSTKRFSVGTNAGNYTHTVHPTADTNFGVRAGSDFGAFTGVALESRNDADAVALPLRLRASGFWFDTGFVGVNTTVPQTALQVGSATTALNSPIQWSSGTTPLAVPGVLFTQTADKVTTANVATSLFGAGAPNTTLTLPAGLLVVGRTIEITMGGYVSAATAAGTHTLLLSLGGVTVATGASPAAITSVVNTGWQATARITCRTAGAGGTVVGGGEFRLGAAAAVAESAIFASNTTTAAANTTGTLAVDLTLNNGVAAGTYTTQYAVVTLTN